MAVAHTLKEHAGPDAVGVASDPHWSKVWEALNDGRWSLRTIDGLAKQTGLSKDEVGAVLERHSDEVRKAYVPDRRGRLLFAPADRRMGLREVLATAQAFVAKSI